MAKPEVIKRRFTGTQIQLEQIWTLKKVGVANHRIAEQVGIDRDQIPIGVKEYAAGHIEDLGGMDAVRAIENSKLDDLQGIWFQVLQKKQKLMSEDILVDEKEIERITNQILKIAERRSRLLGLDAPIKHQVNLRVFDQFTTMMIEAIQKHVPADVQKAINDDIQAALLLAERYRSEDQEGNEDDGSRN